MHFYIWRLREGTLNATYNFTQKLAAQNKIG
jgi:hypothetical protein